MWRKFYRCNNDNALYGLGNLEGSRLSFLRDGTRCDFFRWQASYVVLLIREGFVTNSDQVTDFIMIALNDHSKALESLTTSIRDTKRKLDNLEEFMKQELVVMKQELDKLKAAMVENEENKKSMDSALELMKGDLQKLEGSTTVKPRMLGMCSLGLLLLVILIGWFLMGLKNGEEKFMRLVLNP
ncbi:unnamed protein product [Miscanthus lutarioriparius]|uniref:Uncharacterized protein n=1 Tax=Miscanthus lutarioriparius TaxID=422564 RepID=A0A811R2Y4_9POAL|nr:unnamed protein product [Miscanthus lutarioriparius]